MVVEAHRHCAICGKPIPLSESFCSDKCQEQYQEQQNNVAKTRRIFYILIAIFVVVYLIFMFMR